MRRVDDLMTPKERYLAAIHHEETDRVPIYAGLDAGDGISKAKALMKLKR